MMKPVLFFTTACMFFVTACDNSNANQGGEESVNSLIEKTMDNLVYVEGGSFQMGDFGRIDPGSDGAPYSFYDDNKELHKVTLDDYFLLAFKVTYKEFDVYTSSEGLDRINSDGGYEEKFRGAKIPAGVDWYQAHDYCQWLKERTGMDFTLPSEAQWEYAARSRGMLQPYGTQSGEAARGRDIPTDEEIEQATGTGIDSLYATYPVDIYPPNSLGIYQMGDNGFEWVSDWYAKNYYSMSPEKNPQGPESGTKKVQRGLPPGEGIGIGLTIDRNQAAPNLVDEQGDAVPHYYNTFRCALNQGSL